jgi:hypothetical protein
MMLRPVRVAHESTMTRGKAHNDKGKCFTLPPCSPRPRKRGSAPSYASVSAPSVIAELNRKRGYRP